MANSNVGARITQLDGMAVKATTQDVGKQVLVLGIGEDPILAIITKVDELSGLVIEVLIKDPNKEEQYLIVKDKVILYVNQVYMYLPLVIQIWGFFKSLWKMIFGKKTTNKGS